MHSLNGFIEVMPNPHNFIKAFKIRLTQMHYRRKGVKEMTGRHYAQPANRRVALREIVVEKVTTIPQITVIVCVKYSKHIIGGAILHVGATIVALWILGIIGPGEH